jgi:hypothetical protein
MKPWEIVNGIEIDKKNGHLTGLITERPYPLKSTRNGEFESKAKARRFTKFQGHFFSVIGQQTGFSDPYAASIT